MKNNFFSCIIIKKWFKDVIDFGGPLVAGLSALNKQRIKEQYRQQSPKQNIGGQIFSLVVGIFAGYLSWTCNTVEGVAVPLKVFYAFFAFLFGPLYLIIYAIMRGFKICK
jgi:hypothetical protein